MPGPLRLTKAAVVFLLKSLARCSQLLLRPLAFSDCLANLLFTERNTAFGFGCKPLDLRHPRAHVRHMLFRSRKHRVVALSETAFGRLFPFTLSFDDAPLGNLRP